METIPAPPKALAAPTIARLEAGAQLHRVHGAQLATSEFNPCKGADTRFAPIRDRNGRCVPSLYAGSTVHAAIFETILHDVLDDALDARLDAANRKTVPRRQVAIRNHGAIELMRDVRLASLRRPDLTKWGLSRALVTVGPSAYQRTAEWAKALHDQFPHLDGLIWTSNRCDPDDALLFFGDRVAAADLRVVSVRLGAHDKTFLRDVRDAAGHAGIGITN